MSINEDPLRRARLGKVSAANKLNMKRILGEQAALRDPYSVTNTLRRNAERMDNEVIRHSLQEALDRASRLANELIQTSSMPRSSTDTLLNAKKYNLFNQKFSPNKNNVYQQNNLVLPIGETVNNPRLG